MLPAARAITESSRYVATLSLDEPMNELVPWRWFCAAGWQSTAVMNALEAPAPMTPARVTTAEPEGT